MFKYSTNVLKIVFCGLPELIEKKSNRRFKSKNLNPYTFPDKQQQNIWFQPPCGQTRWKKFKVVTFADVHRRMSLCDAMLVFVCSECPVSHRSPFNSLACGRVPGEEAEDLTNWTTFGLASGQLISQAVEYVRLPAKTHCIMKMSALDGIWIFVSTADT